MIAGRVGSALLVASCVNIAGAHDLPPAAYQRIATQADVPSAVLYAVALQESGIYLHRRRIPWPWTLNLAGVPKRYATRTAACHALQQALTTTAITRIDVGLGQINLGYHAQRYTHPCELLDPYRNLAVAAAILREQYAVDNDWLLAIGRYHRPAGGTPAARYRRNVVRHLARMAGTEAISFTTAPVPRP